MKWIWRHRLKVAAALLVFVFILPVALGFLLRGTVESKVADAVKSPVKLGALSIHVFPPGATLSSLAVGDNDAAAGNQPFANIGSLRANVGWGTVLGGAVHVTSLKISDAVVSISVDENGTSSLDKFQRRMPPSDRKEPLPIDSMIIRSARIHTYLPERLSNGVAAEVPDSRVELDYAAISNLVLPGVGSLLGREIWTYVDVSGVRLAAPQLGTAVDVPNPVGDGLSLKRLSLSLAQAPSAEQPLQISSFSISGLEVGTVYTEPGKIPALNRALAGVQLAFASEQDAKDDGPKAAGILINDLRLANSRIETRGPDGNGKPAYWRLNNLTVDAANLAIGPQVKAAGTGHLKVESPSESSGSAGKLLLALSEIKGGYPKWSFNCDYKLEGVAATAYSVAVEDAARTKVNAGAIGMDFAGPAENGKLKIDGGLTLSQDFEVNGVIAKHVARMARGNPIRTIRVRGTLENPEISYPDAIAGVVGNVLEQVMGGGMVGVLNTAGSFMDSAVGQGWREATKTVEGATGVLKKIPGFDAIFGGEKK